jgi:hypothetical protein
MIRRARPMVYLSATVMIAILFGIVPLWMLIAIAWNFVLADALEAHRLTAWGSGLLAVCLWLINMTLTPSEKRRWEK